jgi:hypothetical protein
VFNIIPTKTKARKKALNQHQHSKTKQRMNKIGRSNEKMHQRGDLRTPHAHGKKYRDFVG